MTRRLAPLCALLLACGADPGERPTHPRAPAEVAEAASEQTTAGLSEPSAAEPGPDPAVDEPPTPPEAPRAVTFDLLAHPERAITGDATGERIDFDGRRDGEITLGGFRTRLFSAELGERHVVVSSGRRATLLVPYGGEGTPRVQLSLRAFRGGPTEIRLGGRSQTVELPTDGSFTTVDVDGAGVLRPGLNQLTITTRRSGQLDGRRAGFAVEWIHVGDARAQRGPRAEGGVVALPAGSSLTFCTRVAEGARLELDADGPLTTSIATDEGPWRPLTRPSGADSVSLDSASGRLISLRIGAGSSDVTLRRARITRPAEVQPRTETATARNVLIYLIDTLRADHLDAYAPDTRVETPGLDRFLRDASVFLDAHAQENWTKPSVATLLTSLYPWQHTATEGDSVLPRSAPMLSERLHERGYRTAAFIANGYVSDRFGFGRGWDDYRNYIREGRRTKAQYVAADVLSWLDAHGGDGHFFLYVHTIDPHVPYRPPRSFLERYGDADYRGPVNFSHDSMLLEHVKTGALSLGAADRRQLEALYDAEISYHDVHFDRIMDGLARRGLADDTLVVVTADHGEEFWDHDSVGHGHSLYEELLHVPLFVRWPGQAGARRIAGPAGLVDVVPTVFDALGEELPAGLEGRSLAGRLRGESPDAPGVVVSGFFDNQRAAVVDGLKVTFRRADRIALYDLEGDPHEAHDLAAERPRALRHALAAMGRALAATTRTTPSGRTRRTAPQAEHTTIDPETAAQLRALGYAN